MADDRSEAGRSRLSAAVNAVPVLGDLARQVEGQARWIQQLVEQNARLVGQLPATMKSFNDSLERFNQTVGRLDRAVSRIETSTARLAAPVEQLSGALDPRALRELPDLVQTLRREALPALRAATDTQQQMAVVQATLDRIVAVVAELPGAGILRRMATSGGSAGSRTRPAADDGSANPERGDDSRR